MSVKKIQSIQPTFSTFLLHCPQHHRKVLIFYWETFVDQLYIKYKGNNKGMNVLCSYHSMKKSSSKKLSYRLSKLYNRFGYGSLAFSLAIDRTKFFRKSKYQISIGKVLVRFIQIISLLLMEYYKNKLRRKYLI